MRRSFHGRVTNANGPTLTWTRENEHTTDKLKAQALESLGRCGEWETQAWGTCVVHQPIQPFLSLGGTTSTGTIAAARAWRHMAADETSLNLERLQYRPRLLHSETGRVYRAAIRHLYEPEEGTNVVVVCATNRYVVGTGGEAVFPGDPTVIEPPETNGSMRVGANVTITEPDDSSVGDEQFVFQGFSEVRACEVCVSGTSGISSQDANLVWTIDTIPDTTLTSDPEPAKGSRVTFIFAGEPANNSAFGATRELVLSNPLISGCQDTANLHFFFDSELGNIHETGPNWFVYWKQEGVVVALQAFQYANTIPGPVCELGYYDYKTGNCYITNDAYREGGHNSYSVTNSTGKVVSIGLDLGEEYDGISRLKGVAAICAHELQHKEIHGWRIADPVDTDKDGVPDAKEVEYGLDPNNSDTYNLGSAIDISYEPYGDEEFLARQAELGCDAVDSSRDWSAHGCNWRQ